MRPGDLLEQRYRLVRVLGRGRSGSVWCARNELIDRAVAVKVLHRSLASDPERLQRFFQEARACGRVRHPSVVEVLDLGQGDDGVLFLVMELLEGETMASLLGRRGRLSVDEALALVVPLAQGLAAAHTHGILHRDLKPANIYLHKTPLGGLQPKILDFGISKIIGNDVTATGVVLGTPSYMSPEQAHGVADLDARTDVWSLGVILYEALTGRLPFIAKEYRALVDEIIERRHVPVAQLVPDVPPEVARIVDDALEKSRDRRLASASLMAQRLTGALRSRGRLELRAGRDDDFSDGAPTLTHDREELLREDSIDDTAGVIEPLFAVKLPGEDAPVPLTKPSLQPKAVPAAGAHPRQPDATYPDPLPLVAKTERSDGRTGPTRSWEVSAAKAASGRAEVLLSGAQRAPALRVDDQWDTTVADVSTHELEKGPEPATAGPKAAPQAASRASVQVAPPAEEPKRPTTLAEATRKPATTQPTPKLTPTVVPNRATATTQYVVAPPLPAAQAEPPARPPVRPESPSSKQPPTRSSSPPAVGTQTLRPPPSGFAAPAHGAATPAHAPPAPPATTHAPPAIAAPAIPAVLSARPSRPPAPPKSIAPSRATSTSSPRTSLQPQARPVTARPTRADDLLAPELYALGDQRIDPFGVGPQASKATLDEVGVAPLAPPVLSAPSSSVLAPVLGVGPAPNPNLETDRHRRRRAKLLPILGGAIVALFVLGAGIGLAAARSGRSDGNVRRFTAYTTLLVAFHDQSTRASAASTPAAPNASAAASGTAPIAMSAAPQAVAAPPPATVAVADPAPPPATAAPPPPTAPAPPPPPPPKVTAPASKPKTTTPKPKAPASKPTAEPQPKKKSDWWQKKF